MITGLPPIVLAAVLLAGCQTAEEIRREKMVEAMHGQLGQSQKLNAEFTTQLEDLDKRLNKMQGRLEELEHQNREGLKNTQENLGSSLAQTQEQVKQLSEQMRELQQSMQEQRSFIEKVTQTLSQVGVSGGKKGKKESAKDGADKKDQASDFDEAMGLYRAGKYKSALPLLETLANDTKLSGNNRSKAIHGAAYIKFLRRDWDGALVLFSRLYSELPQSTMAASALLHLGKIFEKKGQKAEASSSYNELVSKFPKSKHVSEAKAALEKLK